MDITIKSYFDNADCHSDELLEELHRDALFGDGFFTTTIIKNSCIINRERHLNRLKQSAERLKFKQWNGELLVQSLNDIAESYPNSILRVSCSRKQKERGYAFSLNSKIQCNISVQKLTKNAYKSCHLKIAETPISVNALLGGIKHLNRLDNVMASSECDEPNQEVLMCDGERVICGSRSNLFVKINGEWIAPIISDCGIDGITQNLVIEKMNALDINCKRQNIYKKNLENVSASFVTNSILGIWPVESLTHLGKNMKLDLECVMELIERLKMMPQV